MQTKDYGKMVHSLLKKPEEIVLTHAQVNLLHVATGLAGEACEVLDEIKKHCFTGKPLNREKILTEMGDDEFYMEGLRQAMAVSRETILGMNMQKLSGKGGRYEHGYSDEAAVNRVDTEKK
jgi:hypothetical protein